MPKVGDKEFPYTPEGMAAAKAESENMGIPVNDGANRSVTEFAGGGKTGYNMIGMQNPMMGHGGKMMKYEDGGKTDKVPQNPKDKGVTDPAKKYEEGGKTSERKSDIEIEPGKYKKTSKVVTSVGSIDAEAEARLKNKLKQSKNNDANLKIKGEIDSLKNVLKNETNSMKQKLLKEKINAKSKLIAEKDKLKKDLKKDTHDSDMDAMKAKLKAAGMKKMKHGGKIDKNKDIRNKMQLKKNLMSDLKVGDSVYSNKRKPGMSTKMKTGKLSIFEKNEAKRTDKDFNTFKLKKKKKI